MADNKRVVVLGGGVIGLTSALVLARKGYKVHVVARDMPEDKDSQGFASPWAGANWCPFGKVPRICQWETETFKVWESLIPKGLAIRLPDTRRFEPNEEGLHGHWYKAVVPKYARIPQEDCPPNSVGVKFDTLSVNSPVYILWLKSSLEALGATFEKRQVASLDAAFACFGGVDCVVNATGLGAKSLIGVLDQDVQPIRGQTVLIKAETKHCSMDCHDLNAAAYIIPRPGGEVICGGCFEVDEYNTQVDFDLASKILQRCLALDPSISSDGTLSGIKVLRHNVGLRPGRRGGPRLERQEVPISSKAGSLNPIDFGESKGAKGKGSVVHAYGLAGAGYQTSWGVGKEVGQLVDEHFAVQAKAKL